MRLLLPRTLVGPRYAQFAVRQSPLASLASRAACLVLAICVARSALPATSDFEQLVSLFGPADVSTATGNGALTICTNTYGRVTVCRWPSPGYYDQISYRTRSSTRPGLGVKPWHGVMWGVRVGDETVWITGPPWETRQRYLDDDSTVIETAASLPGSSLLATQTLFVHPERDLLVARLVVQGIADARPVYWYADFSPCTRLIPEIPIAGWLLDVNSDFAAFAADNGQTVYHFRPNQVAGANWEHAEELVEKGASASEWEAFESGVWIAYASPNAIRTSQCGVTTTGASAFVQASSGALAGARAAVGSCNSAVELVPQKVAAGPSEQSETGLSPVPGPQYVTTVFVAFASERRQAEAALAYATERGYDRLLDETKTHWRNWLGRAALPATDDQELVTLSKRCLLIIAAAMDRNTGAVMRALTTQPPLALDWPRHGIWVTRALDVAGYRDLAEKHCLFYLGTVRTAAERAKPAGSVPTALYANRVEAMPHVVLDVEAAAWLLWSLSQHAALLEPDEKAQFLSANWKTVEGITEFLLGWADNRTGLPLHSFDYRAWRDTRWPELLLDVHLGMSSGLQMALALSQPQPPWQRRIHELEALIQYYCIKDGHWAIDQPVVFWPLEMTSADMPPWDPIISQELGSLEAREGGEAIKNLYAIAQLWRNDPAKLTRLRRILRPVIKRVLSGPHNDTPKADAILGFPDSINAALCYLAAMTTCEHGPAQ